MGVSQWINYGKKYGYYDYFKSEVVKEIEKKLPNLKYHICRFNDGKCGCYVNAINDIKNILKTICQTKN